MKDVHDMASIWSKLAGLPPSHAGMLPFQHILQLVHEVSAGLRQTMGNCPAFADGGGRACPFKTVCSDGVPLVSALEQRRWAAAAVDAGAVAADEHPMLSQSLKDGTKDAHKAAESCAFVRQFLAGNVAIEHYAALLAELYHLYCAMEAAFERAADDQVFGALHAPVELARRSALEEDLEFYAGPRWRETLGPPAAATQAYIDRIEHVAATRPPLLIAHAFTRYLGDLSGGQTLARVARKTYSLPATGGGAKFYQFDNIDGVRQYKKGYRGRLDCLGVDRRLADELVAEANLAFGHNAALFEHMDKLCGFKAPQPQSQPEPSGRNEATAAARAAGCPFAHLAGSTLTPRHTAAQPRAPAAVAASSSGCPLHSAPRAALRWLASGGVLSACALFVAALAFWITR